nr:MAG TPA: hypothetical protein [Inoviridae sp.]
MIFELAQKCRAKAWSPVNHARSNSGIFTCCAWLILSGH